MRCTFRTAFYFPGDWVLLILPLSPFCAFLYFPVSTSQHNVCIAQGIRAGGSRLFTYLTYEGNQWFPVTKITILLLRGGNSYMQSLYYPFILPVSDLFSSGLFCSSSVFACDLRARDQNNDCEFRRRPSSGPLTK